MELFSGYEVLTDNLSKRFNNGVPVGIGLDICYKDWTVFVRASSALTRTKDSIVFNSATWHTRAQASLSRAEASIGYVTLERKRLVVTPFIGIGLTSFIPTSEDKEKIPEYENIGLKHATTYTLGLTTDIKIGKSIPSLVTNQNGQTYVFIRLRYAYNMPNLERKYMGFNGNIHALTVGVGLFRREMVRDN